MEIMDIIVVVVISTVVSVMVFIIMEAYLQHMGDNELTETEFYPDTTTYDVEEMECLTPEEKERYRGGVIW